MNRLQYVSIVFYSMVYETDSFNPASGVNTPILLLCNNGVLILYLVWLSALQICCLRSSRYRGNLLII